MRCRVIYQDNYVVCQVMCHAAKCLADRDDVSAEPELAMKFSDLTEPERKVWQAALTGTLVDLQMGDPEIDSSEKWAEWGTERAVRAEVIVARRRRSGLLGCQEGAS